MTLPLEREMRGKPRQPFRLIVHHGRFLQIDQEGCNLNPETARGLAKELNLWADLTDGLNEFEERNAYPRQKGRGIGPYK